MIPKEVHNTFRDRLTLWWEPNGGIRLGEQMPKDEFIELLKSRGYSEGYINKVTEKYGCKLSEILGHEL